MVNKQFWMARKLYEDRGSNGAEYALLIGFIAVGIILGVGLVGFNLNQFFGVIAGALAVALS